MGRPPSSAGRGRPPGHEGGRDASCLPEPRARGRGLGVVRAGQVTAAGSLRDQPRSAGRGGRLRGRVLAEARLAWLDPASGPWTVGGPGRGGHGPQTPPESLTAQKGLGSPGLPVRNVGAGVPALRAGAAPALSVAPGPAQQQGEPPPVRQEGPGCRRPGAAAVEPGPEPRPLAAQPSASSPAAAHGREGQACPPQPQTGGAAAVPPPILGGRPLAQPPRRCLSLFPPKVTSGLRRAAPLPLQGRHPWPGPPAWGSGTPCPHVCWDTGRCLSCLLVPGSGGAGTGDTWPGGAGAMLEQTGRQVRQPCPWGPAGGWALPRLSFPPTTLPPPPRPPPRLLRPLR